MHNDHNINNCIHEPVFEHNTISGVARAIFGICI